MITRWILATIAAIALLLLLITGTAVYVWGHQSGYMLGRATVAAVPTKTPASFPSAQTQQDGSNAAFWETLDARVRRDVEQTLRDVGCLCGTPTPTPVATQVAPTPSPETTQPPAAAAYPTPKPAPPTPAPAPQPTTPPAYVPPPAPTQAPAIQQAGICNRALTSGEIAQVPAGCTVSGDILISTSKDGPWNVIYDNLLETGVVVEFSTSGWVHAPWGANISSTPWQTVEREMREVHGCYEGGKCTAVAVYEWTDGSLHFIGWTGNYSAVKH